MLRTAHIYIDSRHILFDSSGCFQSSFWIRTAQLEYQLILLSWDGSEGYTASIRRDEVDCLENRVLVANSTHELEIDDLFCEDIVG